MYKKILNILNNYIDNDKNPDVEFITSIIRIFNKSYYQNKTIEYIKLDNYEKFDAKFSPYINTIFFNTSLFSNNTKKSNVIETLLSIFHEYIHVIQYENTNSNKNNICDKLVYMSFTIFNKNNSDDSLHDHIPIERLANISSLVRLINVLNLDKEKYNDCLLFYKRKLFQYLIKGYEINDRNISCSLEILFNKTNLHIYNDTLVKESYKLSFRERLLYGLPITPKEYKALQREYINTMYDEEEYKNKILKKRKK